MDVNVISVNDNPEALSDEIIVHEDSAVLFNDLLQNDSDLDGDDIQIHEYTEAEHGNLIYNGEGSFTYIPDPGFSGEDSFTYTIIDENGGTSTATVDVVVSPKQELEPEVERTIEPDEELDEENIDDWVDPDDLQILDPTAAFQGQMDFDAPQVETPIVASIEPEAKLPEDDFEVYKRDVTLPEFFTSEAENEPFDPDAEDGDFDVYYEEIDFTDHLSSNKEIEDSDSEKNEWSLKTEQEEQAVKEDTHNQEKGGIFTWLWAAIRAGGGLGKSVETDPGLNKSMDKDTREVQNKKRRK